MNTPLRLAPAVAQPGTPEYRQMAYQLGLALERLHARLQLAAGEEASAGAANFPALTPPAPPSSGHRRPTAARGPYQRKRSSSRAVSVTTAGHA
jgi:hypothetical protein